MTLRGICKLIVGQYRVLGPCFFFKANGSIISKKMENATILEKGVNWTLLSKSEFEKNTEGTALAFDWLSCGKTSNLAKIGIGTDSAHEGGKEKGPAKSMSNPIPTASNTTIDSDIPTSRH